MWLVLERNVASVGEKCGWLVLERNVASVGEKCG